MLVNWFYGNEGKKQQPNKIMSEKHLNKITGIHPNDYDIKRVEDIR